MGPWSSVLNSTRIVDVSAPIKRALPSSGTAGAGLEGRLAVSASAPASAREQRRLINLPKIDPMRNWQLTVKLRGRPEAPDGAEGAQFLSARGAKPQAHHGPLQRWLDFGRQINPNAKPAVMPLTAIMAMRLRATDGMAAARPQYGTVAQQATKKPATTYHHSAVKPRFHQRARKNAGTATTSVTP
jgi:hypothetical protein